MDVVNQAMTDFEGGADADAPSSGQLFIPAPTFHGRKSGYYFTKGPQGTGYYLDEPKKKISSSSNMPPGFADDDLQHSKNSHRLTGEELLEEAEEAAGDLNLQIVDSKVLKKLVSTLERKFNQNVEQRIKYASEPQKFLESEIELDEAVRAMTAVATSPELYPDLVTTGAVATLISLLHHENGDIAAAAIELLSELTDADAVEDSEAEAAVLVTALLEGGLLEALVQRLQSLNESIAEEAAAVYNALSLIENAVELQPDTAAVAAAHPGLFEWMLKRLRPKTAADGNKQYTAEVLAVILQSGGEAARKKFVQVNGVELMLRAVAPYKARDPETAEEEEFVENAFDVLCAVLMEPGAKKAFVEADGAELMALILKARTAARAGALKCLDFATTRCPPACDQLVDFGGLGTVFALFMGKLKPKKSQNGGRKNRDASVVAEEEERCMSLVCNLLSDVTSETRRARVAAKFAENEFEKCDRLMEIYSLYEQRVKEGEAEIAARYQQDGQEDDEEEIDQDEVLMARLDAGLFTLQQAAIVAAELWAVGDVGVRKRLLSLLHQRGRTLSSLRNVLVERRATLAAGTVDGGEESEGGDGAKQVERATMLLHALGYQEEEKSGDGDGGGSGGGKEKKKRSREEDDDGGNDEGEEPQPDSTRQKV